MQVNHGIWTLLKTSRLNKEILFFIMVQMKLIENNMKTLTCVLDVDRS